MALLRALLWPINTFLDALTYWTSEKHYSGKGTPAGQFWDRKINMLADVFADSGKPIKPNLNTNPISSKLVVKKEVNKYA